MSEAVEDAAIHKPDVALMDIRLARGTSGIDASCEVYSSQGLRCIFLSANLDEATRCTLNLCQPIVFINQPISKMIISRFADPRPFGESTPERRQHLRRRAGAVSHSIAAAFLRS
jgi:CheY-like chemotaxis protein